MSEWKTTTLGSILPFRYGKGLPKRVRSHSGEYAVVSSAGRIDFHSEPLTDGPTVVIGRKGSIGSVFYCPDPVFPIDTTFYVQGTPQIDIRFAYYLLRSLPFASMDTDAAVPGLNRENAERLQIRLPTTDQQRKISDVLGGIDDLIENNRRRVEILEEMARVIYREWFVKFRYPGHEDVPLSDSTLGPIPEGWEVCRLGDLVSIASGKRPPSRHSSPTPDANVPVVGASSVMAYTERPLTKGSVLVTGRVGTHGVVQRFSVPIWPSDNTFVVLADKYEYSYQVLLNVDYLSLNRGAAQPLLAQRDLANIQVMLPRKVLLTKFENEVASLMLVAEGLADQIRNLSSLRDLLLPKLVTGQIDISTLDLDALIEEQVA